MSRSLKKEPFVDERLREKIEKLLKQIAELKKRGGKEEEISKILFTPIKVWCRDSTIFPELVGFTLLIHNGKRFIKKTITEDMASYKLKLGDFALTRKMGIHGKAGTH